MKKKILQEQDFIEIVDLPLCVALQCYGYEIEALNRENVARVEFIFKRDKTIDGVIQDFWKHQLRVEPATFAHLWKETKSRIYNG